MAHSQPRIITFSAESDLSALQYTFVKLGTAKHQVDAAGANGRAIGILMNAPVAGGVAEVAINGGGAKLKVSETVALGKLLTSTSGGLGEVADAAGEWCAAIAFEDGVANDVIGVEVIQMNAHASDA